MSTMPFQITYSLMTVQDNNKKIKAPHYWPSVRGTNVESVSMSQRIMKMHRGIRQVKPWWRHQMETFSALLAICAGNSPVPGEVTRSFDVFFDLRLNKRLSKQWWGWWFETLSCPLWRHRNAKWSKVRPYHSNIHNDRKFSKYARSRILQRTVLTNYQLKACSAFNH